MCRFCQAFAQHLGQADRLLDEAGGTEVIELAPAQLRFTQGAEQLRCLRLSRKGALRFYTACCKTPLGNSSQLLWLPWVSLPHLLVDKEAAAKAGLDLEAMLGPVKHRIFASHATGPSEQLTGASHPKMPKALLLHALSAISWNLLRGRGHPSPFRDNITGQLLVDPVPISREERAALSL